MQAMGIFWPHHIKGFLTKTIPHASKHGETIVKQMCNKADQCRLNMLHAINHCVSSLCDVTMVIAQLPWHAHDMLITPGKRGEESDACTQLLKQCCCCLRISYKYVQNQETGCLSMQYWILGRASSCWLLVWLPLVCDHKGAQLSDA